MLEFAPFDPRTGIGVGLQVHLEGDAITHVEVEAGLGGRGLERAWVDGPLGVGLALAEHLHDGSISHASLPFCLAVEELLGLRVPPRAVWLRMLVAELARVDDHLTRIGRTLRGLGADARPAHAGREAVRGLFEAWCGARVDLHLLRVGGIRRDLPEGWAPWADEGLRLVEAAMERLEIVLQRAGCRARLVGLVGPDAEACRESGITGPLARAAGVPADLRTEAPYLGYEQLEIDVPVGARGDNLDRAFVCCGEIRASLQIVAQVRERVSALAERDLCDDLPPQEGWPEGEASARVESANGGLGFKVRSAGADGFAEVRCETPSVIHLAALPAWLVGAPLDDLRPTLDLVNLVTAEVDL